MEYSSEQLTKHFRRPVRLFRMSNTLVRLYPILEGFDATTAGLYAYMRSWRNSKEGDPMNGIVWHSRDYLQAQSGLGEKPSIQEELAVLKKYGLVSVVKSPTVANKDYFVVHDPLTRDEFIAKYPEEVEAFFIKVAEINARTVADRERRQKLADEKLAEEVRLSHLEQRAAMSNVQNGNDDSVSNTDIPI